MKIQVKFHRHDPLAITIVDTDLGRGYVELMRQNYLAEFPRFRDRARYTVDYMIALAQRVQEPLGWSWVRPEYPVATTRLLHKNIEELLGGPQGFAAIPDGLDEIIYELHDCLHSIEFAQSGPNHLPRSAWFQIEWYNNSGFELTDLSVFQTDIHFGDIRLQNPHVGHGPLQIYTEKDWSNIRQTCRFHDTVRPGINISIIDYQHFPVDPWEIVELMRQADPEFVREHTAEKIRAYCGHPVVGRVENLATLESIVADPEFLTLEEISFG